MANERNAGAKPKFGTLPTKKLRIERVILETEFEFTKEQVNEFINQLQTQALDKCVEENLKKDGSEYLRILQGKDNGR